MNHTSKRLGGRTRRSLSFETLETRRLLSGNPIITEFMANNESILRDNASPRKFSDWVEIHNSGDEPLNMLGWHLTDSRDNLANWTFPSVEIPAGGFLVVFASGLGAVDGGGYLHADFSLKADAEYLALVEPDGRTVASEFNADGADYPRQYVDVSYGLVQEVGEGGGIVTRADQPRYFLDATPGAPNFPSTRDTGPVIIDAIHTPNVPNVGEDIIVSAAIRELDSAVGQVQLHYRVGFGGHSTVGMFDDGMSGGDETAGDGIYTGTIPAAGGAAPGEMIRWYVEATDAQAHESRWPMFKVRTGSSPGYRESEEYLGTVVADPGVTSQIPIYQLFVQNPTAADQRSGTRASVFYDGEFYDNVFIRERGNSSAQLPKTNHRINFSEDHRFRFDDAQKRLSKVNLQANFIDPSYIRETMEAEIFRQAGVPSPITQQVRLELNGEFFQLAGFVEHIDEDFLDRVGLDPNGALYKNPITLNMRAEDAENRGTWASAEKITRIDIDGGSKADLGALAKAIDELNPDDERARYILDNVNIPAVINYMAIFHITQEADSMHINVMVYRDSDGTEEWRFVPFDMNYSFGEWFSADFITGNRDRHFGHPFYGAEGFEPTVRSFSFSRLQDAIIKTPETREMYLRRLRTLMDEFLQPPGTPSEELRIEALIQQYKDAIQQDAELDRAKWGWPSISWHNLPEVSFDEGIRQITDIFLPERRVHLYERHSVDNLPDSDMPLSVDTPAGIPHAQIGNPPIFFGDIEFDPVSGNQDEEYLELRNPNDSAVDVSGWRLTGGVRTTFQPGTVIPAGGTLYVTADAVAFRNRAVAPTGGMRLFVQSYDGHLSNFGETVTLVAADGQAMDQTSYEGAPSPQQLALRVTEINYNPAVPTPAERAQGFVDNDDFEFIELQNMGPETIDLTGVRFTEGIDFEFKGPIEGAGVLITEAGTLRDDWAEVQNVTESDIDTADWIVVANNASEGLNVAHAFWTLPDVIPAGETVYATDDDDDSEHYWGDNIRWTTYGNGWVLVLDDTGSVVDFVAWGYDDAELASLDLDINGTRVTLDDVWRGSSVPGNDDRQHTLQRHGDVDHNDATDWAFAPSSSQGAKNVNLTVPFARGTIELEPSAMIVVARNTEAFTARYGTESHGIPINLVGQYAQKLSNGGEAIKLEDPRNRTIHAFRYDDGGDWPGRADAKGATLEFINPTGGGNTLAWDEAESWRSSSEFHGSPGVPGTGQRGDVVVNEVLSNTGDEVLDAIELRNMTDRSIDIGGWFLSDSWGWGSETSDAIYRKFRVPDSTIIDAGGYLVFDENDFNPSGGIDPLTHLRDFTLDGFHGDDLWLVEADPNGELLRFVDHAEFPAAALGETLGRVPGLGGRMVPLREPTLGYENTPPRLGALLISEVMYHPVGPDGVGGTEPADLEFIEIHNTSDQDVTLTDWRIRGGIDFDFASGATLAAYETVVVLPFDPHATDEAERWNAFRAYYDLAEGGENHFVGPYSGSLANDGEEVRLERPGLVSAAEPEFISRLLEDEINYLDETPWPMSADGAGDSLARSRPDLWGVDPLAWNAMLPTPGTTASANSPALVVARHVFYNDSRFDGNDPKSNASDDAAIAVDKSPLRPGETATFANYTSCSRGLNGVMVDIASTWGEPTLEDFEFRVYDVGFPVDAAWIEAPAPVDVSIRLGEGAHGSDRVTLIWENHAIANQWLQVTVLATENTGLVEPDMFYWGNAIGETGNDPSNAMVTPIDDMLVRNNRSGLASRATIDDPHDFNRDGLVNIADRVIARSYRGGIDDALPLITASVVDELALSRVDGAGNLPSDASQFGEGHDDVSTTPVFATLDKPAAIVSVNLVDVPESTLSGQKRRGAELQRAAVDKLLASYWT